MNYHTEFYRRPIHRAKGSYPIKIKLDWDPKGQQGPTTSLPDLVTGHPKGGRRVHEAINVGQEIDVPA